MSSKRRNELFINACRSGDYNLMRKIAKLSSFSILCYSLSKAIHDGCSYYIIKELIKLGINDFNEGLLASCSRDNLTYAKLMIENGANIYECFMESCENEMNNSFILLSDLVTDSQNLNGFRKACTLHKQYVASILIEKRRYNLNTYLKIACECGNLEIAIKLVLIGADNFSECLRLSNNTHISNYLNDTLRAHERSNELENHNETGMSHAGRTISFSEYRRMIDDEEFLKNEINKMKKLNEFKLISEMVGSRQLDEINPNYICPISHQLMEDPVITSNGNTYCRNNISQWLEKCSESKKGILKDPLTGKEITNNLIPNLLIRKQIIEWLEKVDETIEKTP